MHPVAIYLLAYAPHIVAVVTAGALLATLMHDKKRIAIAARTKALREAVDALASLSNIASNAAGRLDETDCARPEWTARAYAYRRAYDIVNSIPEDRV